MLDMMTVCFVLPTGTRAAAAG
eukprot:COSAG02_NODE_24915_length_674_cov_0.935652_1_plen_21_part_01